MDPPLFLLLVPKLMMMLDVLVVLWDSSSDFHSHNRSPTAGRPS